MNELGHAGSLCRTLKLAGFKGRALVPKAYFIAQSTTLKKDRLQTRPSIIC